MKRIGRILLAALFASAVWTSAANAQPSFFQVTVDLVGQIGASNLGFRFTDTNISPVFTFKRFRYTGLLQKQFLAVALTAIAADLPVFVLTDPFDGVVPEILHMFVQK